VCTSRHTIVCRAAKFSQYGDPTDKREINWCIAGPSAGTEQL